MATSPLFDQTVVGVVTHANEKGIRLDVSDGWCNVSKFAVGVVLPERGARVAVTLDKAGFIRAIAPAEGAASSPLPVRGGSGAAPTEKDRPLRGANIVARDDIITRLAVLKAAAEFGASRPQLKSGEVLAIAESWERWVNRSDDPVDDLTEAF